MVAKRSIIASIVCLSLLLPFGLVAQTMTSTSYYLQFDSVNSGGGFATSSSYTIEDTLGEVATGRSTSTSYRLGAGYQQMDETVLTITQVDNVELLPGVGITVANSVGSETLVVTTDNAAGYNLFVKTTQNPALQHEGSGVDFSDYTPAIADTPENWSVGSGASEFGFSVYDSAGDVDSGTWGDAQDCGSTVTGDPDAAGGSEQYYDALSTSNRLIAQRNGRTANSGTAVTFCFAAGTNAGEVNAGEYTAVVVATLVAL